MPGSPKIIFKKPRPTSNLTNDKIFKVDELDLTKDIINKTRSFIKHLESDIVRIKKEAKNRNSFYLTQINFKADVGKYQL